MEERNKTEHNNCVFKIRKMIIKEFFLTDLQGVRTEDNRTVFKAQEIFSNRPLARRTGGSCCPCQDGPLVYRDYQWDFYICPTANIACLRSLLNIYALHSTCTKRNRGSIVFVISFNNCCTVYNHEFVIFHK